MFPLLLQYWSPCVNGLVSAYGEVVNSLRDGAGKVGLGLWKQPPWNPDLLSSSSVWLLRYDLDMRHDMAQTWHRTCRALLTHMLTTVEFPRLPTSLRAWDEPWNATVSQSKPLLSVLTIWNVCYRKEKLNTLTKLNCKAWIESFQPFLEMLNKDEPSHLIKPLTFL